MQILEKLNKKLEKTEITRHLSQNMEKETLIDKY